MILPGVMCVPTRKRDAAVAALTLTYLGTQTTQVDGATSTLTFGDFGAEDGSRWLIAVVKRADNASVAALSGVTIGGVTADLVISHEDSTNRTTVAIYIANVPTGAAGDVVATWAATVSNCSVDLYRSIMASGTAADTDGDNGSGAMAGAGIDCPAGGFIIGGYAELGISGSNASASAASDEFASVQTGLVIECTSDGTTASWTNLTKDDDESLGVGGTTTNRVAMALASWGP